MVQVLLALILFMILHDKALPIYGDGQQIRDWLYVEDHAYGIDLVLQMVELVKIIVLAVIMNG